MNHNSTTDNTTPEFNFSICEEKKKELKSSKITVPLADADSTNMKNMHDFNCYVDAKVFVIIIALTHGLLEVGSISIFFYQKLNLLLEPQIIQMLAGIITFPWCIKPVFGYICDNLIRRVRKTKYIIVATSTIKVITYSIIAHYQPGITLFYLLCLINSTCSLFENIIAEYILVLSTKKESEADSTKKANHFPLYFGYRALGALIGSFSGGKIMSFYKLETNFLICSSIPLVTIFMAYIYKENAMVFDPNEDRSFRKELSRMKQLVLQENVLMMIIFICLINMTPNFDALVTFYLTDHLRFTTSDLSNFSSFATVCYILGLVLYSNYFKDTNPKKFYVSTNFMLWLCNISFLLVVLGLLDAWGFNYKLFCMLSQGATSLIAEMNFMPILAIWCTMCPVGLEATSITLFTGLINLSNNLSNYFGSFLIWLLSIHKTDFNEIWKAIVLQNTYLLIMMLAVVFVGFPEPGKQDENKSCESTEEDIDSSQRAIDIAQ